MHAARGPRSYRGATEAPSSDTVARKIDRIDLLARMINLRTDCVTLALAKPSHADIERQHWKKLHREAQALGTQWAKADPVDALKLVPSLLTGLSDITERFGAAYTEAAHASAVESLLEQIAVAAECDERE